MATTDAENHYAEGWGWGRWDGLYAEYMWVWVALAVLTVVEVFIPEPEIFAALFSMIPVISDVGPMESLIAYLDQLQFNRVFVVVSLIVLALVKTWLVAWYYMHLIAEKPAIILVACAPFVFSLFLTVGIFPWQGAYL
jgi:cytochrome c oxidase subunit IV